MKIPDFSRCQYREEHQRKYDQFAPIAAARSALSLVKSGRVQVKNHVRDSRLGGVAYLARKASASAESAFGGLASPGVPTAMTGVRSFHHDWSRQTRDGIAKGIAPCASRRLDAALLSDEDIGVPDIVRLEILSGVRKDVTLRKITANLNAMRGECVTGQRRVTEADLRRAGSAPVASSPSANCS